MKESSDNKQTFTSDEKELMKRYLKARFEESQGSDKTWDSAMKKLISHLKDAPTVITKPAAIQD